MKRWLVISAFALAAAGCQPEEKASFPDDCTEQKNNSAETADSVPAEDGFSVEKLQLCQYDVDFFTMTVEPNTLAYFEVTFPGTTDLVLELYDDQGKQMDQADSGLAYERVGILTPERMNTAHTYYLAVSGYDGSTGDYSVNVRTFPYVDGLECQEDCYRIMQFPAPHADDDYLFDTWAEFRNARRELIMLIRYALDQTYKRYPETNPLGLIDMSERNGATPGTAYDSLRHPEGTHIQGNDMDIAYFQTGANNHARPVCANDGYFCTSDTNTMDAEVTAYFMAQIYASGRLRVIGVDTKLADDLEAAALSLYEQGAISLVQKNKFQNRMAYGEGWPFHHHHMHVSLNWLDEDEVYESNAFPYAPLGFDVDPYLDLH